MSLNGTVSNPLTMHDVRRLAPASLEVMQRHAGLPVIAAHATTLVPAASRVLTAIQDLDRLKGRQVALLTESTEQTAQLNALMISWSGLLARDVASFDIGAFVRNANLPFDVVQKATSLMRLVEAEGADLPYQEALLTELTARIEGADRASKSASAVRVELQDKQREVRELSGTFYKGLVSLRRAARGMLGANHFDYQRLRATGKAAAAEPPSEETQTDDASGPSTTA
jgi:hypothetical protein